MRTIFERGSCLTLFNQCTQDYDAAKKNQGSDGCLDGNDPDNTGLMGCLAGRGEFDKRLTIQTLFSEFCSEVSLADLIIIVAEALMDRASPSFNDASQVRIDFASSFRFGRSTADTCDSRVLPNPERSCKAVEDNFVKQLGLTWSGAAALMGVHTLGRASKENLGYQGWWSAGGNQKVFDNGYYVSLMTKGWMPKNMGPKKNQWVRSDGGDALEVMLDTDMCLLFETPPKSLENLVKTKFALASKDSCCAWVANKPNGLRSLRSMCKDGNPNANNCCQDGGGVTCNDEENPQGSPGADAVKLFGNNQNAWLTEFASVWTKVTENGAKGLFNPTTCSNVQDWLVPRPPFVALDGSLIESGKPAVFGMLQKGRKAVYVPICGLYFADNNHGAQVVCRELGFKDGTVSRKAGAIYEEDSLPVGTCLESDNDLTICTGGGNAYSDLGYPGDMCRAGKQVVVNITCWDTVQPTGDHKLPLARSRGGQEVRAEVPFVPEILWEGKYRLICGHFFWDNHHGATAICRSMGFLEGGTVSKAGDVVYEEGSLQVGKCTEGQDILECKAAGNAYKVGQGTCKAGRNRAIRIACKGSAPTTTTTISMTTNTVITTTTTTTTTTSMSSSTTATSTSTTPTPVNKCQKTCVSQNCDYWVEDQATLCKTLETEYGCNCGGCACKLDKMLAACSQYSYKGDGNCDDGNNNAGCAYDGGDCCEKSVGGPVQKEYCVECKCLDPNPVAPNPPACGQEKYKGDGNCDDDNNNTDCAYDGGDCCEKSLGGPVKTDYCTECKCLDTKFQ